LDDRLCRVVHGDLFAALAGWPEEVDWKAAG
jgi:hypothetical protein